MSDVLEGRAPGILTPDQRLRVFVSSTLKELGPERRVVGEAIGNLRLTPVMFELGARPHAPRDLYRSYLGQSHVFVGIYWESYGWVAPGMDISGLEDEFRLAAGKPRLIYVKEPAEGRSEELARMLEGMDAAGIAPRTFATADELGRLVADDLALLLTERFARSAVRFEERAAPSRAPAPRDSFVGREAEVQTILDLLRDDDVRLVTLYGSGGIGKTRLALEVADRARGDFPDGVEVFWLDSIWDPRLVAQSIAAQLEVRDPSDGSLIAAIGERLSDRKILLVFDNFEHLVEAAEMVVGILLAAGSTKCVVTSRTLLQVRGEHAVEILPLPVPDEAEDPEMQSRTAAFRLFVDRARAVSPNFTLTPENARAVAEICRRLEGLPLALELAAARSRTLSPAALVQRLDGRLELLKRGPRDLPERQRTIRAMIDWSYDLLEPSERSALQRLSVFSGGASLDAAQAVVSPEDPGATVDLLAALIDKSLIRRAGDSPDDLRFKMLEMITEYGRERLDVSGDGFDVRNRHALYFLEMAETAERELHSPKGPRWFATLEREHENLQAALAWFRGSTRIDEGLRLALGLQWFWWIRGHFSTAQHWFDSLLATGGRDERLRGRALVASALMADNLGSPRRAKELYEEAVAVLESVGDADGRAWGQTGLGRVMHVLGEQDEAYGLQLKALQTFEETGDLLGQCNANTRLAGLAASQGDYEATEVHMQESLAARRALGDPWGTGYVLSGLGAIRVAQGDPDGAEVYLTEALPLLRWVGSRDSVAACLASLGNVAEMRENWSEAAELYEEALAIYRSLGSPTGIAEVQVYLGRTTLARGAIQQARDHLEEAFDIAWRLGAAPTIGAAMEDLACVLTAHGDHLEAVRLLGAADRLRTDNGLPRNADHALRAEEHVSEAIPVLGRDVFEAERAAGRLLSGTELEGTVRSALSLLGVSDWS